MRSTPTIVSSLDAFRHALKPLRTGDATVALVPTMGALHEGHLTLVRLAKRHADYVVVSIFINPTQFGPGEDLASYPRTWEADLAKLQAEQADLIWHPSVQTMYCEGFATRIVPEGPAIVGLEDRFRPHFFSGVATVVGKLFAQCHPDVAVFGEKDYQQLRVVSRMVTDLDLGVKVIGAPTVREADGLAMSSRNVYLSGNQRYAAPQLYRAMNEGAQRIRAGEEIASAMKAGASLLQRSGFSIDYFEARDSDSLAQPANAGAPLRILAAARLGSVRLIDNIAI